MAFNEFQAVLGKLVKEEDIQQEHVPAMVPTFGGDDGKDVQLVEHKKSA